MGSGGGGGARGHGPAPDQKGEWPSKPWEAHAIFASSGGVLRCAWAADAAAYSPPYHRTYPPIERCWGILEVPWHGTKLVEVATRVAWAKTRTWKGMHPLVELRRKVDQKGVTLSKQAMRAVADRLQRHPELPQWDMLIRPVSTSSCRIFFLRNRLSVRKTCGRGAKWTKIAGMSYSTYRLTLRPVSPVCRFNGCLAFALKSCCSLEAEFFYKTIHQG